MALNIMKVVFIFRIIIIINIGCESTLYTGCLMTDKKRHVKLVN